MTSLPLITLCAFSRTKCGVHFEYIEELGEAVASTQTDKLDECPLDLFASRARLCPCRGNRRLGSNFDDASVRGAACCFPNLADGQPIRSPAALRTWVLKQ